MRRVYRGSAFSMLLLLAGSAVAPASEPAAPVVRRIAIGPQYKAGGLHRSLWGDDYRALWTKPIEVEVLDLATFAGGLTPVTAAGCGSPGSTAPTRSAQPTHGARAATRSTSTPGSLSDGVRNVARFAPGVPPLSRKAEELK
jgi:hypothetical protein